MKMHQEDGLKIANHILLQSCVYCLRFIMQKNVRDLLERHKLVLLRVRFGLSARERAPSGVRYERNIHNERVFALESAQIKVPRTNLRSIKLRGTVTMTHACTSSVKRTHSTNSITGRSGTRTRVAVPFLASLPRLMGCEEFRLLVFYTL